MSAGAGGWASNEKRFKSWEWYVFNAFGDYGEHLFPGASLFRSAPFSRAFISSVEHQAKESIPTTKSRMLHHLSGCRELLRAHSTLPDLFP